MNSKGMHVYRALQHLRDEDHCRSSLLQILPLTHLVEEEVNIPRVSIKLITAVILIVQGLKWRDQCPCFDMGRDIPSLTKLQALQMAYNMPSQSAFDWEVTGMG